ncbi:hypothetical protein, partial [Paenibacillus agaridevorans]|uniref:hypothetical protein n=1 Tax=Paenibacillus agaridevorans TaxID=171404 RepID=UPI0015E80D58
RLLLSWMNGILSEAEREELAGLDWLRGPGAIILTQFHPATGESGDSGTGALIAEMERVCGRYGPACTLPLDVSPSGGCELLTLLPWLSPAFVEGEHVTGLAVGDSWKRSDSSESGYEWSRKTDTLSAPASADEAELLRDLRSPSASTPTDEEWLLRNLKSPSASTPTDAEWLLQDLKSLNEAWHRRGRLCHTVGRARNSMWEEGQRAFRHARSASAYHFYEKEGGVLVGGEPLASRDSGAAIDSEALYEALQRSD